MPHPKVSQQRRRKTFPLLRRVEKAVRRAPSLVAGQIAVRLLWFDSVAAKSMSVFVETPDVRILIDPGASGMQPSFPLEEQERDLFKEAALDEIEAWAASSDVVVITHYHHDHYVDPNERPSIYAGKRLLVKDPNQWINRSQWGRARRFWEDLARRYEGDVRAVQHVQPGRLDEHSAHDEHPIAFQKDFGDYNRRRQEVLQKGLRRTEKLRSLWQGESWLKKQTFGSVRLELADGRTFRFGNTVVRFTPPLYHGVEFATVGWVVALVVEHGASRFLFTSDLQGPTIEDYAAWIVREQPNIAIVDGPPTYLFGQLMNRINLDRCIHNAIYLADSLPNATIIYDHHLPRDPLFRKRLAPLYEHLRDVGHKRFLTMAEWCGLQPLVEQLSEKKSNPA